MKLKSVGEIIAERELSLTNNVSAQKIRVLLGKPQPLPESSGHAFCPWQIVGIGDERVRYAAGVDGVQAHQLAMKMIGTDLSSINRQVGGSLRWELDESGDLGFPLLIGDKWSKEP